MAKFTVYGRPSCPWCVKATDLLASTDHPWSYMDLTQNPETRQLLIDKGHKTVPVVYHGYKVVGGYEALIEYLHGLANE